MSAHLLVSLSQGCIGLALAFRILLHFVLGWYLLCISISLPVHGFFPTKSAAEAVSSSTKHMHEHNNTCSPDPRCPINKHLP